MKRILFTALFTLIISPLVLSKAASSPGPVPADCKPSITGYGSAKNNEPLAKARAKDDWRDRAKGQHGGGYQHWLKAAGPQLTCSASGRFGNRTWNCAATAQPCK